MARYALPRLDVIHAFIKEKDDVKVEELEEEKSSGDSDTAEAIDHDNDEQLQK